MFADSLRQLHLCLLSSFAISFMLGHVSLGEDQGAANRKNMLSLSLRKRVETQAGSGRFHTVVEDESWRAEKTAVIVCDMWDLHHCLNATRRGVEMAPRMNELLNAARDRGATIIHAPSSCLPAYADHPARKRVLETPLANNIPQDIAEWCHSIPSEEQGEYPIDQSDGGEDDDPQEHQKWAEELKAKGRNPRAPWKSQTDLLDIHDTDYISDKGEEVWSVLEYRGIDNVILVGVHTNMCVLGRPFGLRQMAKNGKNVVLIRDLTDTMYNPPRAPFVSHFTGTDLIVEHIEKWVCPTVTSDQILGGKTFRFKNDDRPHLVVVMAEQEYQTNRTLPEFCLKQMGQDFQVSYVFANENDRNDLPGIEQLEFADLALISVRRRVLPPTQMVVMRKFVESGKPIVCVRTASHAFSLNGQAPPDGCVAWAEFDRDVLGGNYTGHHGDGKQVEITLADGAQVHAILDGVDTSSLIGFGSLYKAGPLSDSTTALLIGSIPDVPAEPVAWINESKYGGRVFYTSLAHPDDFSQPVFNRLLQNAVHWAAGLPNSE